MNNDINLAREACAQVTVEQDNTAILAERYRAGEYDSYAVIQSALRAIKLYRESVAPVPANPELDEATFGAVADRVVEDFDAKLGARTNYRYEPQTRTLQPVLPHAPLAGDCPAALYDKLVAPQGRKQVTIFVPERGIDGKTIRPLVVEKELNQVFGWYLATHGVRGSADSAKTPLVAYTVAVADDLGVRDAVGIAGRAAALTGAPVTVTLDTGDMVKVDAEGRFV